MTGPRASAIPAGRCLRMVHMEATHASRITRSGAALIGALAVLTACGGGDGGDSSPPESTSSPPSASSTPSEGTATGSASEKVTISISDFEYSVPDSVPAGAQVTITNTDDVGHTVTADEGDAFDRAVGAGKTVHFTAPEKAGKYPFHCTPHPYMTSTLVVK